MSRIDLHLHTTYSDGSLSPREVLARANAVGVTALAITDHDTTDGLQEAFDAGGHLGIEVIPGMELSSQWNGEEVHILGYFINWQDETLQRQLEGLRSSRRVRMIQMLAKLREQGMALRYQDLRSLAGTSVIGRPHLAQLLLKQGYVRSIREAFDRYLTRGSPAYVPRDLPEPAIVMSWIRAAGGVPVLAHPRWGPDRTESLFQQCERLKEDGLRGLEIHYSTHHPQQVSRLLSIARRLNLLVTGGSDFHGETKPGIEVGTGFGTLSVSPALLPPLRKAAVHP